MYQPKYVQQTCMPAAIPVVAVPSGLNIGNAKLDSRTISRVEILWRTLVADQFEGVHPVPVDCGFGFSDWICQKLQLAEELTLITSPTFVTLEGKDISPEFLTKLKIKEDVWQVLEAWEPTLASFYSLQELRFLKGELEARFVFVDQDFRFELETGGLRYIPNGDRVDAFIHAVHSESRYSVLGRNLRSTEPSENPPF
jgi:hypothetical protein